MKDLEAKFFKYCCKNIIHDKNYESSDCKDVLIFRHGINFIDLIDSFIEKYPQFSKKQIESYLLKWVDKGIVDYNVYTSHLYGWFCFSRTECNIVQYLDIIPSRIYHSNSALRIQIDYYKSRYKYYQPKEIKKLIW